MTEMTDRELLRRFCMALVEATGKKSPSLMLLHVGVLRAEAIDVLKQMRKEDRKAKATK